ncbi:ATP-binding protein [Marinomonas ostreistagni]|uniref:ATP-binding protein n=1 Tax=Marinomonas ostreistagni TaxID=359209 RepID=UPI0019505909|nr:ATP-binding protein [Marinomonas ostreistagni]MBM6551638.1 response regulator [Marinomonas ostreistagni]
MSDTSPSAVKQKLWKAISLPIIAFIIVSSGLMAWFEAWGEKLHFEQINQHLTQQSANASEYALLLNDSALVATNTQDLLQQQDVIGVTYYDSNKDVLNQAGHNIAHETLTSDLKSAYLGDHAYVVVAPIFYQANSSLAASSLSSTGNAAALMLADAIGMQSGQNKDLLGWIELTISTKGLTLDIIQLCVFFLFYGLLAALICLLICRYIVNKTAPPYDRLTQALAHIANGEYQKAHALTFPPYMASLNDDLTYIADKLANYRHELETEIEQITQETRQNAIQLEEQSAQLYIANKEATESNRLKTQFLANISHEVRTPLNAILGYTKLLQKDQLENQQKTYVDTIEKSTHNLLATIGDILDFSKIESGKLVLEPSDFNLRELIEEVFHTLSSTLLTDEKDLNLIPKFSSELPEWLKGDAIRIRQILTNLVGNAIKFTQTGSVEVIASMLSHEGEQIEVQIQVKDTGIGIPASNLNQLFKPFSQVDPSSSRNYAGTGLGLVITRKLIEQMNGKIDVESEPNRGSNFHFTIQLKPSSKADSAYESLNQHLLILEPNKQYRDHIGSFVQQLGVTYEISSSIEQLMQTLHLSQTGYDAALLHVDHTERSISETAELVQYLQTRFGIHCTLMTKPSSYIEPQSTLYQLVDSVLLKPVSPSKLHQTLLEQRLSDTQTSVTSVTSDPTPVVEQAESDSPFAALHILAVDDTPVNLQLLGHWLKPHNIQLTLANSGIQALELAQQEVFDLVLMDIQMPQMDGMEATRQLRQRDDYKDVPIIALTAHALEEEKRSMLASGMNAYLTKPVNEEILLNTINEWCTKNQSLSTLVDDEIRQIFDVDKAVAMTSQNISAAKEIFDMFMDTLKQDKRLLPHQFANQELDKLIATVHRIHGASKYTGCIEVIKHANFLETHLKELGFDEVDEVYQDFMEAIEQLESIAAVIPWSQASQTPQQTSAHLTS